MISVRNVKVPVLSDHSSFIKEAIAHKLKVPSSTIKSYQILHKSCDARDKNNVYFVYQFGVECFGEEKILKKRIRDVFFFEKVSYTLPPKGDTYLDKRPIIVGSGPSGLFCAYMLAMAGYRPIIFERGESIPDRIKTVDAFFRDKMHFMKV